MCILQGKYKGCECVTPFVRFEEEVSAAEYDTLTAVGETLAKLHEPKPVCDLANRESIPAPTFDGPAFKGFCSEWNQTEKSEMTVDITGQIKSREKRQKVASLQKRTPPPDINELKRRYDIHLAFKPSKNGVECSVDCNGAFHHMALQCQSPGRFAFHR
jgi:hypothetical protein